MKFITPEIAENIFKSALGKGIADSQKATFFYVKSILEHRLSLLSDHFPENTLHSVAIKTNNHPEVLKHIVSLGYGLEAASLEEVMLAKNAGAANFRIVFDSPVKTQEEISYCVENLPGLYVNANCLEELQRYPEHHLLALGLRINPLVQNDAEGMFDVAHSTSKFGVPINLEDEIITACIKHNVTVLHFHIGSGIKNFRANIRAVEKVINIAQKIDQIRIEQGNATRITTIDIGGGIHFDLDDKDHSVEAFCEALQKTKGIENYQLITEYGAFIHKNAGFVVSKIEYVIDNGSEIPALAYLHVGADLFLRKVYSNLNIDYPYSVIGKSSQPTVRNYNVVGPLCFSGDILYEKINLPELTTADYFVMYNTGANTYSMWSEHCSRNKIKFLMV